MKEGKKIMHLHVFDFLYLHLQLTEEKMEKRKNVRIAVRIMKTTCCLVFKGAAACVQSVTICLFIGLTLFYVSLFFISSGD